MTNKVQMLGVVCRTASKHKLELIAFCDGATPAGVRPITAVTLQETGCLRKKLRFTDNIMLTAWFNEFDKSIPVSQQALVVLIEADELSLHGTFDTTPLGHAAMAYADGTPVHLPSVSVSTRKKLYASHWDQMRGLLREYQRFMTDQREGESAEEAAERAAGEHAQLAAEHAEQAAVAV